MMNAFFIPAIAGYYEDTQSIRLPDVPESEVRRVALANGWDKEDLEVALSYHGKIEFKLSTGKLRYTQK